MYSFQIQGVDVMMEKKGKMSGMMDNRMVSENHQQGIERVKMRKGDLKEGQGGKMGAKGASEMHWRRSGTLTPRQG